MSQFPTFKEELILRSEQYVTNRPAQSHVHVLVLLLKHGYNGSICTDHHQATITKDLKIRQNTL